MKRYCKKFSALLSLLLVVVTLVACSQTTDPGASETGKNTNSNGEKITLTFSYWGSNQELESYDRIIQQFEKDNPQYKIEPIYTDGGTYPTKLQTFFSSNTVPDVMAVANDVIYDFVQQDKFLDLKPLMEKDGLLDGTWAQNAVAAFTYDEKIIASPQSAKPFAIVYNKKIFDEAGVPYPTAGWTESEFVELAKTLTTGEGADKIYGMHLSWMTGEFLRNLYNGHQYYDVDKREFCFENDEAFKHSFELFSSLVGEYGASPNSTEAQSVGGGFETGRFAMSFVNTWDLTGYNDVIADSFEWEVVPLPVSEEYGQWNTPLRMDGIAISASSEKQEAAWEFVKYLTTTMETAKVYDFYAIPAFVGYTSTEEYKNSYPQEMVNEYDRTVFPDALNYGVGLQNAGVWDEVNSILLEEYERVLLEGITVDKALQNIASRTENKLN